MCIDTGNLTFSGVSTKLSFRAMLDEISVVRPLVVIDVTSSVDESASLHITQWDVILICKIRKH